MLDLNAATKIVKQKMPNDLIRSVFEYKNTYRFLVSSGKIFIKDDPTVIYAVVDKNTGDFSTEGTLEILYKFYDMGEDGIAAAKEYREAEDSMQPVDVTADQFKAMK